MKRVELSSITVSTLDFPFRCWRVEERVQASTDLSMGCRMVTAAGQPSSPLTLQVRKAALHNRRSVTGQWQVSDRSVTGQWHVSYMSFSCVLPVVQIPVLSNNVDRSLQIHFNCSLLRLDKHQYKWYSMKSYLCSQSPVTARNSV